MNEENYEVVRDFPVLNDTVEHVVQIFKNHEEELQKLDQRKWSLESDIADLRKVLHCLEQKKTEIDDDITRLKLRNIAYQKEHTSLRNSITVVKFQIQKIKESIAEAKGKSLKALEDFEKAVDEVTVKFRQGPVAYDRKVILENIEKEKEKKVLLMTKIKEVKESHEDFNKANGLRLRKDENEELLSCILPGSQLFCYIEMTKTLDEVISGIKNVIENSKDEKKSVKILIQSATNP